MDNELYHHGIKGQKWGVRRYQNKDGSLTYAGKKRALKLQDKYTNLSGNKKYSNKDGELTYSGRKKALKLKEEYSNLTGGKQLRKYSHSNSDAKTVNQKPKTKLIKEMSNEELQAKIDRMGLEQKYRSMMKESASSVSKKEVSKGKQFVNEVITNAGKNVATQAAVWAMGTAVNKAIEGVTGEKGAINPKKGQKDK